ncbi:hypothetical protein MMC22_003952 [Lobaria immixta]|nr:hypothetical protein [Lobaria immixta]
MHAPSTILLTSIVAFFSTTISAAPACVVPAEAFVTLFKPFTLTAIGPRSSWSVLLQTPTATKETQPYISHSKAKPAVFRLTEGKLTTVGAKGQTFAAHFGPSYPVFPPDLDTIYFGGTYDVDLQFYGGFGCDNKSGKTYKKLFLSEPLVVDKVAEGEKIYGQPESFEGTDVALSFQINEL